MFEIKCGVVVVFKEGRASTLGRYIFQHVQEIEGADSSEYALS